MFHIFLIISYYFFFFYLFFSCNINRSSLCCLYKSLIFQGICSPLYSSIVLSSKFFYGGFSTTTLLWSVCYTSSFAFSIHPSWFTHLCYFFLFFFEYLIQEGCFPYFSSLDFSFWSYSLLVPIHFLYLLHFLYLFHSHFLHYHLIFRVFSSASFSLISSYSSSISCYSSSSSSSSSSPSIVWPFILGVFGISSYPI